MKLEAPGSFLCRLHWRKKLQSGTNMKLLLMLAVVYAIVVLQANTKAQEATITIHADQVLHTNSPYLTGACIEDVNHEIYGGLYSQLIFGESFQEPPPAATAPGTLNISGDVSAMWHPVVRGSATGAFAIERRSPFVGAQSQRIAFTAGDGEIGIENRGLHRWGMNIVAGKS